MFCRAIKRNNVENQRAFVDKDTHALFTIIRRIAEDLQPSASIGMPCYTCLVRSQTCYANFACRSTPCPAAKTVDEWLDPDLCEAGDSCQYCHTRTEQQFHPEIYKSTKCNDMLEVGSAICLLSTQSQRFMSHELRWCCRCLVFLNVAEMQTFL